MKCLFCLLLILSFNLSAVVLPSKDKFDFIPKVLEENKVEKIFHKITQKPGKPLWFGVHKRDLKIDNIKEYKKESSSQCAVFGLPGNPVSAVICMYRYIFPYINELLPFIRSLSIRITLGEHFKPHKSFVLYVPVNLIEGKAFKTPNNGSGDLTSLSRSEGFVQILANELNEKDSIVSYFPWSP